MSKLLANLVLVLALLSQSAGSAFAVSHPDLLPPNEENPVETPTLGTPTDENSPTPSESPTLPADTPTPTLDPSSSPSPTPEESLTPTPPTPTGEPSETPSEPTPPDTPSPTAPTETSTPTVSPTASPSVTPTTTFTPTFTPTPAPGLILTARPDTVTPGEGLTTFWQIDKLAEVGKDLTLQIGFPEGFVPLDLQGGVYDAVQQLFTFPIYELKGEVRWSVKDDVVGPYNFGADLLRGKEVLSSTSLTLQEEGLNVISDKGGQAVGLGGRVKVTFPDVAVSEQLEVRVREPAPKSRPPYSLSGQPFEITAKTSQGKQDVKQFSSPLTIQVEYDDQNLRGDEMGLFIFYYDENDETWRPLRTDIDPETNTLTATSDHLTNFDIDIQSWQSARLPSVEAFQVSSFTGAATYSLPITVPPGPGGLQPSVTINYNSQVVDAATLRKQASWVGMGWSLDLGAIDRDMNGTDNYLEDDVFSISVGGISSLLLPANGTTNGETGYYKTADESYWRIHYNSTTDKWTVWDKTGTVYSFGDNPDTQPIDERAKFPYFSNCDYEGQRAWRWPLVEMKNVFGKAIKYTYVKEEKTVNYRSCGGAHDAETAIYPESIVYPNNRYRVWFSRTGSRTDWDNSWNDDDSLAFYDTYRLNEIQVEYDDNGDGIFGILRKYSFTYNSSSEGIIFPFYTWSHGGKTLTLKQVQEYGLGGTTSLPATTFTYGDGLHLTEADNGSGGKVEFSYESTPWYELYGSEPSSFRDDFGPGSDQPCHSDTGDTVGWQPRGSGSTVECEDDRLFITGEAIKELPAALLQPGGRYRLYSDIGGGSAGTSVQLGLRSGTTDTYQPATPVQIPSGGNTANLEYWFNMGSQATTASVMIVCGPHH